MMDQAMDILNAQSTDLNFSNQQLIFLVGNEEFGIDILQIQEMIRYFVPVKVPNSSSMVSGVINFRGEVIPVLDMHSVFQLKEGHYNDYTVIIVVKIKEKIFGLIVDKVTDMINYEEKNIQLSPKLISKPKAQYVKATCKIVNRQIYIIDLEKLAHF